MAKLGENPVNYEKVFQRQVEESGSEMYGRFAKKFYSFAKEMLKEGFVREDGNMIEGIFLLGHEMEKIKNFGV